MNFGRIAAAALLGAAAAACSEHAETAPPVQFADDAAIRLFERRTEADPRDHLSATTLADLRLRRADRTLDADEYRRAEAAATQALARQAGHPAAVVALARSHAGQGRTDDARRRIDELLGSQPRHVGALAAAFDFALAAGEERTAQNFANRLLAINEEPATLCRLAQLAARGGETDAAVTLFRRAAKDADDLGGLGWEIAEYLRRSGDVLLAAGRAGDALTDFDAAIAADPEDPDALRGRAEILSARGDRTGAVEAMSRAASIRPLPAFVGRLAEMKNEGDTR